jgi:hypothetical protein
MPFYHETGMMHQSNRAAGEANATPDEFDQPGGIPIRHATEYRLTRIAAGRLPGL